MQEEQERAEAQRELNRATQGTPFRFFVKPGESTQVVVVDDAPDFVRHEHALQDRRSKRWDVFVPCIDEHANCPACQASDRPSYFALYLTVIDLTEYENADGDIVEFSKKLLVVKPMQQKKIMRYYNREGTLRGMILTMTRDSKKDASIGDPEFDALMDENELLTYETQYTDREGEVHDVICHEPYDYDAIFPAMDEDQLRALVGGGERSAGSRRDDDRALGRGRGRGDDDGGDDWQDGGRAPTRRVATRRARADEPDADDAQPEAPARGTPVRGAARSAAARAPVRRAPVIDPDDSPDAGQDTDAPPFDADPPQRAARPAPRAGARRPAPEPETAEPARGNVAARRAALRRG